MLLTQLVVRSRMLQVTYDPFKRKHPPAPNRAIKAKIIADEEGVEMVWAEALHGPEFLQRLEVILYCLVVFFDVRSRYAVRCCPTDCCGQQERTVHEFGAVFIRLRS